MKNFILFFRIVALAAVVCLSPAAFSQNDSVFPPDSGRTLHSPADCAVFITGDFESECILPLGKPDTYLNEEGVSLIACKNVGAPFSFVYSAIKESETKASICFRTEAE